MSLQVAVAWTAFTTLLATLDADEAGQTNSRLLLLLPYGIAPAAAFGGSRVRRQRARRVAAGGVRRAVQVFGPSGRVGGPGGDLRSVL